MTASKLALIKYINCVLCLRNMQWYTRHKKHISWGELIYNKNLMFFPFRSTIFLLNKVPSGCARKHDEDFIEWHFNWHLSTSNCKNNNIRIEPKKRRNKNLNDLKGKREFISGRIRMEFGFDALVKTIFHTYTMFWPQIQFYGLIKKLCDVRFWRLPSQQNSMWSVVGFYFIVFLEF